jgi:hypothetical protein
MTIFLIIVALGIAYLVFRSVSKPTVVTNKNKATGQNDVRWLEERWKLAQEHLASGTSQMFPEWYFDEATDRQLEKIKEFGLSSEITKGQASDLIGMHEPAEQESLEVLKFFKVPTRGMKQTQARHEVALIFEDKEKVQAWKDRPPSAAQKEFFKFFGIKLAKGTTHEQTTALIKKHESEMSDKNDPRLMEWNAFEQIIDELKDPDFRENYEIKKPSATLIKQAMGELQKDGNSYQEISDDIDMLINKLIELKPEIERE